MKEIKLGEEIVTFKHLAELYTICDKIIIDINDFVDIFGNNINKFIGRYDSGNDYFKSDGYFSPSITLLKSIEIYYRYAKNFETYGFKIDNIFENSQGMEDRIKDGKDGLIKFIKSIKGVKRAIADTIKNVIEADNEENK